MIDFKTNIEKQIEFLGGIDVNPLCEAEKDVVKDNVKDFISIEKRFNSKLPVEYRFFYDKYGAFCFNNRVYTKSEDMISQLGWGEELRADFFYSLSDTSKCSVWRALDKLASPGGDLLPICYGLSGDLICLDLGSENYGKVYYWFHEGYENETLFLIANDFYSFIMSLEVDTEAMTPVVDEDTKSEDKETDGGKITTIITPELLELLRKSGHEPKNYKLRGE